MKFLHSHRVLLAAASLSAFLAEPSTALAFRVTDANGGSTFNTVRQWAVGVDYGLIWEPRTAAGMVDFAAPSSYVHGDFHEAIEALVSGAVYRRDNVYCVPPSEFHAKAIIDDRRRLVYVTGHPTGRRCMLHIPQYGIDPILSPAE